jgi:hypothetical protein
VPCRPWFRVRRLYPWDKASVAHDKRKPMTKPRAAAYAIALPSKAMPASFNHSTWRRVLVTGVASAALFACSGRPVHAQGVPPPSCAVSPVDGSVVNCTGNQSAGIDLADGSGPFRTLNVFDLTTNIAPPPGDYGVAFTSDGDITLNVNTGPFGIITRGDDATGLFLDSMNGRVTINSAADISTNGEDAFGIRALAAGDIEITSASNISTAGIMGVGIYADSAGTTIVTSSGNIRTLGEGAAGIAAAGEEEWPSSPAGTSRPIALKPPASRYCRAATRRWPLAATS